MEQKEKEVEKPVVVILAAQEPEVEKPAVVTAVA
jgi:hypothetical protein